MKFQTAFVSDIGKKRKQNQDNGGAFPSQGLFIVADGMGGHQGGEVASGMVMEIVPEAVKKLQSKKNWDPKETIATAISEANHQIYQLSTENPDLMGMGTTTTSILFTEGAMTIGHVGDSRAYYFRPGAIWQLTRDHSLVEEKLKAGIITREQLKTDRMKNVITRSVGFESEVKVEIYEMAVEPGDLFLICSDGLTGMLEDSEILEIVHEHVFQNGNIKQAVDTLIENANEKGGEDNVTVLMTQVQG